MRNKATPEKIDEVCTKLAEAWKQYPHQRLGQLLLNISRNMYGTTDKSVLWNLDEDELLLNLEWDDYANCWVCKSCGAVAGYQTHNFYCRVLVRSK